MLPPVLAGGGEYCNQWVATRALAETFFCVLARVRLGVCGHARPAVSPMRVAVRACATILLVYLQKQRSWTDMCGRGCRVLLLRLNNEGNAHPFVA